MTLSSLGKSADVYRWTIHYIEIMRVKPTPKTMYKLAVSLGVNPAELYVSVLEYGMENIQSPHAKTLRIVAQPGETPKQMIARLVHRQLHPFFVHLNKRNQTAKSFLEEVNISKATIKNWIDGKTMPSMKTMEKLAMGFSVSMDNLLSDMKAWNEMDITDPVLFIEQNIHKLEE